MFANPLDDLSEILLYFNIHSERSDECIDFTMMCYNITCRNNYKLWGWFPIKHFPTIFKKIEKNKKKKKKMTEKREFLRKTSFRPNRFFIWLVDNKISDGQTNITFLMIQFFMKSVENAKNYNKDSKHHYSKNFKSRNDNDLSSNDFKYFISLPHKHNFFLLYLRVKILIQVQLTIIIKELKFWCIQSIKT
ncbi:Uncharacterized protein FWK35_00003465, partial [Aphis craccivora]